jgi:hypothetical protein
MILKLYKNMAQLARSYHHCHCIAASNMHGCVLKNMNLLLHEQPAARHPSTRPRGKKLVQQDLVKTQPRFAGWLLVISEWQQKPVKQRRGA